MNRLMLTLTLAITCSLSMSDRLNAQAPSNPNAEAYYRWYWHHHGPYQSAQEREWTRAQQQFFPNAVYGYNGWALPGSVYNNPYSLYGPAANVPTLYYPQYLVGKYDVKVVQHAGANYFAPPQYEYVPIPRR